LLTVKLFFWLLVFCILPVLELAPSFGQFGSFLELGKDSLVLL
jgi:hypothetical protein